MRIYICCLFILLAGGVAAQDPIADILAQVERNNPELKAGAQRVLSQKTELSTQNMLQDPEFEVEHLWGTESAGNRKYDISLTQSFDFPTVYARRGKLSGMKRSLYDGEQAFLRQQVLLRAKELCLEIIYLNRRIALGEERQQAADRLLQLYRGKLEAGSANILDVNKIEMEQLNVSTRNSRLQSELSARWAELRSLNGGEPIGPLPADYAAEPLPPSFESLKEQALSADPELQMLRQESQIASREVSLSRSGWLPRFELGYRHAYELGERFNGLSVGLSIPLFANRGRVKSAKAQALAGAFAADNRELQVLSALQTAYDEAVALKRDYDRYESLTRQDNFGLLGKALSAGQISMVEYLINVTQLYEACENMLSLEYEYHLRLARIYRFEL